jgi:hypothetical protein
MLYVHHIYSGQPYKLTNEHWWAATSCTVLLKVPCSSHFSCYGPMHYLFANRAVFYSTYSSHNYPVAFIKYGCVSCSLATKHASRLTQHSIFAQQSALLVSKSPMEIAYFYNVQVFYIAIHDMPVATIHTRSYFSSDPPPTPPSLLPRPKIHNANQPAVIESNTLPPPKRAARESQQGQQASGLGLAPSSIKAGESSSRTEQPPAKRQR